MPIERASATPPPPKLWKALFGLEHFAMPEPSTVPAAALPVVSESMRTGKFTGFVFVGDGREQRVFKRVQP